MKSTGVFLRVLCEYFPFMLDRAGTDALAVFNRFSQPSRRATP
jgi:hypothetical protein